MSVKNIVMAAAGAEQKTMIEDVFSTYLYTGNGSTQTINNGIDLAGKGGMVWIKCRSNTPSHQIQDTVRGAGYAIFSNLTNGNTATTSIGVTSFINNGFTLGSGTSYNDNLATFASWTFRKAPKFFDVVTYTGNGVNGRQISHSLGTTPGMIVVKRTDTSSNWMVAHVSTGLNLVLNSANGTGDGTQQLDGFISNVFNSPTGNTAAYFTLYGGGNGISYVNASGGTYVAYLFAHDTTTDGLIQCGSFTTDSNGLATVNLGWEPQYILIKRTDQEGQGWRINDVMRGWNNSLYVNLEANLTVVEGGLTGAYFAPTATGFTTPTQGAFSKNATFIYMAIRRGPMRTPTDATKVFTPVARTGTGTATTVNTGIITDLFIPKHRNDVFSYRWVDRLRDNMYLDSTVTGVESSNTAVYPSNCFDNMTGVDIGTSGVLNASGSSYINYAFKRAPGFFDVVVTSGGGVKKHGLGVAPELIIFKNRTATSNWFVVSKYGTSADPFWDELYLNTTGSLVLAQATVQNVTSTQFELYVGGSWNTVAYLFASCPGVSKVGSYAGNGSSQTIDCGFTNGARFFLVKATSTTGNWWVYDTARGVVAAADPTLALNTTAAEVTSADAVDPNSTGIIVNQEATCSINANGVSYIYLAIA